MSANLNKPLRAQAVAAVLMLASVLAQAQQPSITQTVSHGLFTDVQVLRPTGDVRQFVMLLSDNDLLSASEKQLAQSMTRAGAMVATVPLAPFARRLAAQSGPCAYGAGAFENLAHHVQAYEKLPTYITPMLVGAGNASELAYALLAQAPVGTFESALSVGFCPRLTFRPTLCANNALRWQGTAGAESLDLLPATQLGGPWTAMQVSGETACTAAAAQAFVERVPEATWVPLAAASAPAVAPVAPPPTAASAPSTSASAISLPTFEAAYARLAAQRSVLEAPPAQLSDLPIIELPTSAPGQRLAVLLSGDGGWAGIDKGIASALVKQGVPVAGFDSLRYFWSKRTPEGLAADLDRLIRYYASRWKRSEVILIGYSQGADVLPFAINRLPRRTRNNIRLTALLGLGQKASFEFHVTNWIGESGDKPIAPEAEKLSALTTLCVYGADERNSLCPQLAPKHAREMALPGGHHFGGDYDGLATRILDAVVPR